MAPRNAAGIWHNDDWLRQQRELGLSARKIAAIAGCTRATIETRLHQIGLLQRRERVPSVPLYLAAPEPEPDREPDEPPDCLDCPLVVTTCDGCAAYRVQPERWVRV